LHTTHKRLRRSDGGASSAASHRKEEQDEDQEDEDKDVGATDLRALKRRVKEDRARIARRAQAAAAVERAAAQANAAAATVRARAAAADVPDEDKRGLRLASAINFAPSADISAPLIARVNAMPDLLRDDTCKTRNPNDPHLRERACAPSQARLVAEIVLNRGPASPATEAGLVTAVRAALAAVVAEGLPVDCYSLHEGAWMTPLMMLMNRCRSEACQDLVVDCVRAGANMWRSAMTRSRSAHAFMSCIPGKHERTAMEFGTYFHCDDRMPASLLRKLLPVVLPLPEPVLSCAVFWTLDPALLRALVAAGVRVDARGRHNQNVFHAANIAGVLSSNDGKCRAFIEALLSGRDATEHARVLTTAMMANGARARHSECQVLLSSAHAQRRAP
jgi:hypothetical protein